MLNFGEVNSKNQTCDTLQVNFQVCCLVFFGFCHWLLLGFLVVWFTPSTVSNHL